MTNQLKIVLFLCLSLSYVSCTDNDPMEEEEMQMGAYDGVYDLIEFAFEYYSSSTVQGSEFSYEVSGRSANELCVLEIEGNVYSIKGEYDMRFEDGLQMEDYVELYADIDISGGISIIGDSILTTSGMGYLDSPSVANEMINGAQRSEFEFLESTQRLILETQDTVMVMSGDVSGTAIMSASYRWRRRE